MDNSSVGVLWGLLLIVLGLVLGLFSFLLKKEQTARTNYICPPEMVIAIDGNSQYFCAIRPKLKENQ